MSARTRWAWMVLAVLAVGAGAVPARAGVAEDLAAVAPPEFFGVVHVDVAAIRKDVLAGLEAHKADLGGLKVETITALAEKVQAIDVFLLLTEEGPKPLVVIRGTLKPEEVFEAVKAMSGREVPVTKGENGRYELPDTTTLVYGPAASDVADGISLLSDSAAVTPEALAKLGTGKEKLTKLLAGADTAAPIWASLDTSFGGPEAPQTITASIFPGGTQSKFKLVFATPEAATAGVKQLDDPKSPVAGLLRFSAEGAVAVVSASGERTAMDVVTAALVNARRAAARTASQANLSALGKAILIYRNENSDKVPASLAELVAGKRLTIEGLVSPAGKTSKEGWDAAAGKVPDDYVYLALPGNAPGGMIQAYEKPAHFDGKGTLVLLVNGSVRWMQMKDFEADLKKAQDFKAPPK